MYQAKVLGIKNVKFTNDSTGELVEGRQIWLHMETLDPAWLGGYEVFKSWAPAGSELFARCVQFRPGDTVILGMTRTGKVCSIELA